MQFPEQDHGDGVLSAPRGIQDGSSKVWWSSLVGPAAAAIVTAVLAGLLMFGGDLRVTALLGISALVFAVVYVIQLRHAWRTAHFLKHLMGLCVTAAVASGVLPSVMLWFDVNKFGTLHVLADNSPVVTIGFLFTAVAFAALDVYRERHGLPVQK